MTRTMTFNFEQYPLQVIDRFEIGMIDGEAELSYTQDGEWWINSIAQTGTRYNAFDDETRLERIAKGKPTWINKTFPLRETCQLYAMIVEVLEGHKRDDVQEAVREQIEEDRQEAREFNAEVRRELSWEARF